MLTIKDTFGDQLVLGIPNNNVRKQYIDIMQFKGWKLAKIDEVKG